MTYTGVCLLKVMLISTPCWWGAGVPLSQAGTGPPPAPHTPATSPQHGCYSEGPEPWKPSRGAGRTGRGQSKGLFQAQH